MVLRVVGQGESGPPPRDKLDEAVEQAQADLAAAAAIGAVRRDPYAALLASLSSVTGVFGLSVHRWERAVAAVIDGRKPIPTDEWVVLKDELRADITGMLQRGVEDGAHSAVKAEVARLVRTLDGGLMVRAGLWAGGAFVAGVCVTVATFAMLRAGPFSSGAEVRRAWEDIEMANPDPRAALGKAFAGPDGRRVTLFWVDPAKPPAKP